MSAQRSINLLRSTNALSPQLQRIEVQLQRWTIVVVGVVLAVGIIAGGIYGVLEFRYRNLVTTKNQLLREIESQKTKELLVQYIKNRLTLIEKIRQTQFGWNSILDIATNIASPPSLTGLSIDENNRIILRISLPTLEDAVSLVGVVGQFTTDRKIRGPLINSIEVNDTGKVIIDISFFPSSGEAT